MSPVLKISKPLLIVGNEYMLFVYIKPSKSGPEAQLVLIGTLNMTLLREVSGFSVKNDQKRHNFD